MLFSFSDLIVRVCVAMSNNDLLSTSTINVVTIYMNVEIKFWWSVENLVFESSFNVIPFDSSKLVI